MGGKTRAATDIQCSSCVNMFDRTIEIITPSDSVLTAEDVEQAVGNVKRQLCEKCEERFIAWLRKKGFTQSDCWCKHIAEFIKEEENA